MQKVRIGVIGLGGMGQAHISKIKEIIRNFCRSILFKEELIAPGEEGIWSVEFINALILSGKKNKPVDIPVNRKEYEEFLEGLN